MSFEIDLFHSDRFQNKIAQSNEKNISLIMCETHKMLGEALRLECSCFDAIFLKFDEQGKRNSIHFNDMFNVPEKSSRKKWKWKLEIKM